MKRLLQLLELNGRRRRRGVVAVVLGMTTIGASVGLLATSGYLISKAALQPELLTLTVAIVGVRFFGIVRAISRYLERLVSHDVAFRLLADLRAGLLRRLAAVPPSRLARLRDGDLLSRFVSDVDSLQHVLLRAVAPAFVAVGSILLAAAVAVVILPEAAVVLVGALLVACVAIPFVARRAIRATAGRKGPAQAELTIELLELLRGAPELVAYGRGEAQRERVFAADRQLTKLARRDAVTAGATGALATFVSVGAVAAVVAVASAAVSGGRLNGVYVAVLAFLVLASFEAVAPLPAAAQLLIGATSATERIEQVARVDAVVAEPVKPRMLDAAALLTIEQGRFRYSADAPWALDALNLRLAPGRRIAIVGPSGSGKSTIARVLVRFCDLEEGRATLNGHDLRAYASVDVRSEVALGADDAYLFATNIRENVRLAKPSATDGEIRRALERAGAWRWVSALPDGLDTFVGEDGTLISGGQRQRIVLARLLLTDATIVILDEPTAHLDTAAAREFMGDLLRSTGNRGLLLITHRFAGLERFDEILYLEAGRVVERGTHRQLLEHRGRYLAQFEAQRSPDRLRMGSTIVPCS